jgi:hypothetical protein
MQHPQNRQRGIELALEEILVDSEIERKTSMNPTAQIPACAVIGQNDMASTSDCRPYIDTAKCFARQHFGIVGDQFQSDVKSLLIIGDDGGFVEAFCLERNVSGCSANARSRTPASW